MSDYEGISPEAAFLASHLRHVTLVTEGLLRIRQDLERRAHVHDVSKFSPEEAPGFVRINATAREHPYGSPEYRAALKAERPTVERHTRNNSHHPEAHRDYDAKVPPRHLSGTMGFLDIIEMVCDWRGAWIAYGSQGTWAENIAKQKERLRPDWLTEAQWWLVEQVAAYLDKEAR